MPRRAAALKHEVTTVYTSPCGRIYTERHAPRDVWAFVDDIFIGARTTGTEAERIAHTHLCELLLDEAVEDRDSEVEMAELVRYNEYAWR